MKSDHIPLKNDPRTERKLRRLREQEGKFNEKNVYTLKQLRKTQTMRAGHVRGGHAFH